MDQSKEYLKKNNIRPRISFKDGNPHTLRIVKDKIDSVQDDMGKQVEGIRYLVEEGGEQKTFFTASVGLIEKLAQVAEGTEVVVQMKRKKSDGGGYKSFFEVRSPQEASEEAPSFEEELPSIDAENPF